MRLEMLEVLAKFPCDCYRGDIASFEIANRTDHSITNLAQSRPKSRTSIPAGIDEMTSYILQVFGHSPCFSSLS